MLFPGARSRCAPADGRAADTVRLRQAYVGSISASPTACPCTCRRRCRYRADIGALFGAPSRCGPADGRVSDTVLLPVRVVRDVLCALHSHRLHGALFSPSSARADDMSSACV